MKRNTMILLAIAALLGAVVYFLEIRGGNSSDEKTEASAPAFSFARDDIAAITINRAGTVTTVENRDGKWVITQPLNAPADKTTMDSLANSITSSRIERNITASAEEKASYGLGEPPVVLEIKLKSGEQHTVRLGNKDFSGLSVYAEIDGSGNVALLPSSLLTNADRSLDDLRDRSVVSASQFEITSLKIASEDGQISLAKDGTDWHIKSPIESPADDTEVSSVLGQLTSAKVAGFVSETSDNLAEYGLDKPRLTVTATLQSGGEQVLIVGSKTEDDYYAKNSARPQVFKIDSMLYDRLNVKLSTLRDRQILTEGEGELTAIEVKNPNIRLVAEKNSEGKWLVKEPADKKDKEVSVAIIIDPLQMKANEIIDKPSPAVSSKLAKPVVEMRLTGKDGKTTDIRVSSADGDSAYISIKGRSGIYKVGKHVVDDLSFKPDSVIK
ncbi:MAG TPA: DUF4340 domain-containing protein [Blastocatellia bacterium]|nr:DUF4340 domain-containing protein [Blastocatellia bacterium]